MKKLILFTTWLILLFTSSIFITIQKNDVFAAETAACGEGCTHSYGEAIDPKEYPNGGYPCGPECPKCQPGTYSSSGVDYEICTTEDYEPDISDWGGEEFGKYLGPGPIAPNSIICGGDSACKTCVDAGNSWTALGCFYTSQPQLFVSQILRIALFLGGGIAFLLVIFGALQIILSAGNPDRIKNGKEMIIAALGGLILIIFAVFILRLVGYDVLGLPGFKE
ncbi:hypothetical protein FJZ41_03570 [Candidatus Shapirobacteria bacterium]|nr:hypothetical protein [Candidatus Shapirobacteria bacterium]